MVNISIGTLPLALSAALSARRACTLRHLLGSHGPADFARAVETLSSRQMADILSLLSISERTEVHQHLTSAGRARLPKTPKPTSFDLPRNSEATRLLQAVIATLGTFGGTSRPFYSCTPAPTGVAA